MKNDLISREALKKKAETITLWNGDVRRFVSYETIDNAPTISPYKAIRVLSEEKPQGEWIPVSEKLPEALQSVLVTSTSGRVYTSYIVHGEWEYGGNIIAWQPLPEPYKKGGAE